MDWYTKSEAQVKLENGGEFTLVQSTDYPFDGTIRFTAKDVKVNVSSFRLRVPGWSAGGSIKGAGADRELTKEDAGTYLDILVEDPQNMDAADYGEGSLYCCKQWWKKLWDRQQSSGDHWYTAARVWIPMRLIWMMFTWI